MCDKTIKVRPKKSGYRYWFFRLKLKGLLCYYKEYNTNARSRHNSKMKKKRYDSKSKKV